MFRDRVDGYQIRERGENLVGLFSRPRPLLIAPVRRISAFLSLGRPAIDFVQATQDQID
jgi:hypothetical protein